jgi:hypothetical protein
MKTALRMSTLMAGLTIASTLPAQTMTTAARWMPLAEGDLAATRLDARAAPTPTGVERKPVHFAWAIDPEAALDAPQPYTATSRDYWATVDDRQLARGHAVHTTRPGAMVLISPERGSTAPAQLRILRNGRVLNADAATDRNAPSAGLRAATGAPFAPGALGFRIKPQLGAGRFDLQVPNARGRYVVHVHEPDSPYALKLTTTDMTLLAGQALGIVAQLAGPAGTPPPQRVGGLLVAPDGHAYPLAFNRGRDGHDVRAVLPARASATPGLWEVHAFAVGEAQGQPLLRYA